jgi:hypothetical protein
MRLAGVTADPHEHVAQAFDRVDAIGFASGDDRIEAGDVVAGVFVSDKEKILTTQGNDSCAASERLLSGGTFGSSRNTVSSDH